MLLRRNKLFIMNELLLLHWIACLGRSPQYLTWVAYLIEVLIIFMSIQARRRMPTASFAFILTLSVSLVSLLLLLLLNEVLELGIVLIVEELLFLLHIRRRVKYLLFTNCRLHIGWTSISELLLLLLRILLLLHLWIISHATIHLILLISLHHHWRVLIIILLLMIWINPLTTHKAWQLRSKRLIIHLLLLKSNVFIRLWLRLIS